MQMRPESLEENLNRTNYTIADNIDYLDGDEQSEGIYSSGDVQGSSTLITNRSRVYKGGGWDDRAYYLIPGTRRFLDERQSSASIGFRCAMDRMGTPSRTEVNDIAVLIEASTTLDKTTPAASPRGFSLSELWSHASSSVRNHGTPAQGKISGQWRID